MRPLVRSQLAPVAGIVLGTLALLLIARALCHSANVSLAILLGDPTEIAVLPFYVGLFSGLGVMAWAAAASVGVLGWRLTRDRSDPDVRELSNALGGFALLSLVLGIDDLARFHDSVVPWHLGGSKNAVLLVYVVAAFTWGIRFRRVIIERASLPMLVAVSCFAVSILLDALLPHRLGAKKEILEDSPKLVGIFLWCFAGMVLVSSGVRAAAAHDSSGDEQIPRN